MNETWTLEQVRALGVATDVVTAGSVLGLSRNVAYRLAQEGAFPVRVLRLGAQYRVPVVELLRILGVETSLAQVATEHGSLSVVGP